MKMTRNRYKYCRWASAAVLLASICMIGELGTAGVSEPPPGEIDVQPKTTPSQPDAGTEGGLEPEQGQSSSNQDDGQDGQQPLWPENKGEPEGGSLGREATPDSGLRFLGLRGDGETPEFDLVGSVRRMLVALLLALALICVGVLLFKRISRGAPIFMDQKIGRVVGRIHLNPKTILYLVKIADRILVIGANPTTITLITEIADPDLVKEMELARPEPVATKAPFGGHLRQFHARFSGDQQASKEDAKLEEHLRDIKDQMAKLKTLIGGSDEEEH
jgi:flagellar biogenesis protein FliO